MRTAEVKRRFLAHFEANGHSVVPSAALPAVDDPNLLFVNAGMVQFVPYFLGQRTPPFSRATSVQKCLRTPDIEEVGKTSRHGTFFQMNGNFSFGDYFKEGAISFAWDLVTRPQSEGGYGFPESKLYPSVYHEDTEAIGLWKKIAGLPEERIPRLGKEENFWSMGIPGPCGPCSEILIDLGPEYGEEGDWTNGDRYMELWNLVFMQYERGPGSTKTDFAILGDLPARNIDTGMGLERVAYLLQGVDNMYEIDEVRPILDRAAELTGARYRAGGEDAGESRPDDVRLRIVADHVRTSLMLIGDGVTPSNEGRGYVLRRIMRRAVRAMRLLGWQEPALPELLPVARDCMAPSYPEVAAEFDRISQYAYGEEEAFLSTLKTGTTILDTAIAAAKSEGGTRLTGDKAFQLHDTYGFPIDLTLEIAAEQGLQVDEDGFRRLMSEQRARAKADAQARKTGHTDLSAYRAVLDDGGAVEFTGYRETERESRVRALLSPDGGPLPAATEGDELELVLDATPFYAESGGQQPDVGLVTVGGGEIEVYDVQSPVPGLVVHRARVRRGEVRAGETGLATIDVGRRRAISRAHTATHLVHQTMRAFLGESATQAGSLNAPGRLRFDFNTPGAVPPAVLRDVEQQINEVLLRDLEVRDFVTSQAEARRIGAIALFGEKYGDQVRVVEVGDYARELCGGTHASRSSQLGLVKILHESSIGAGVRRVEALVGMDAFAHLAREHTLVARLADLFRVPPDQVADRVEQTVAALRDAEKELEQLRAQLVLGGAGALAAGAEDVAGTAFVGAEAPEGAGGNDVRTLAQEIRGKLDPSRPGVVAVAARSGGKASLVVAVNQAARERGRSAAELVKGALSGRGGGSPDLAQGGGVPAADAPALLGAVRHALS